MSQRKAKEYRQTMAQYGAVALDVDDLKRRIGAMEARHRQEDQLADARRQRARQEADARQKAAISRRHRREREERRRKARQRTIIVRTGAAVLCALLVLALCGATKGLTAQSTGDGADQQAATAAALTATETAAWTAEGEDPLEAEKIEAALLAQGYYSAAVPMCYEYQDYMRIYCAAYSCPYPLALAVAEVESNFDMDAVGDAGEVGIMQINPGPGESYYAELEAATGMDPTTPSGNIAAGCYRLGQYMEAYGDPAKAAMAYNMGLAGAKSAWAAGITSTDYSNAVLEAMERWECTVNAWNGI